MTHPKAVGAHHLWIFLFILLILMKHLALNDPSCMCLGSGFAGLSMKMMRSPVRQSVSWPSTRNFWNVTGPFTLYFCFSSSFTTTELCTDNGKSKCAFIAGRVVWICVVHCHAHVAYVQSICNQVNSCFFIVYIIIGATGP